MIAEVTGDTWQVYIRGALEWLRVYTLGALEWLQVYTLGALEWLQHTEACYPSPAFNRCEV